MHYGANLSFVPETCGDFEAAIAPLEKAVALSKSGDWRCPAELAKVYDKVGRPAEAIQLAQWAVDLATGQNNQQVARPLQGALDHDEHDGAK